MKFCVNCGAMIEETVKFCPNCGTPVAQPQQQGTAYQQPQQPYQQPYQTYQQPIAQDKYHGFKMKWYKFLVYFLLWAGALLNGVNGILTLTGRHYDIASGSSGTSDTIYTVFPTMQVFDIITGILVIGIAVLGILSAIKLLQLASAGPKLLLFTYGATLAIDILQIVFQLIASEGMLSLGDILTPSAVGTIVGAGLMFSLNWIYFKKRESIFVN